MKSFLLIFLMLIREGFMKPLWGWNQTTDYYLDVFPPSSHDVNFISNACGSGWFSQETNLYGYACPHMMMFSEDMLLAAKYDHLDSSFYYATAGSNSDNFCGACYHLRISPEYRDLIVQVINSGGDVGFQQFDLFIGAGGFGVYSACNQDCASRHCNGGPCHESIFTGSFQEWTMNTNNCYGGGIRSSNDTLLQDLCGNLYHDGHDTFKNRQLYQSCFLSNKYMYHQNLDRYLKKRVQCPKGLYTLTGMRRSDDKEYILPIPDDGDFRESCSSATCITTMCDCCKPSCAWGGKGDPLKEYPAVWTCDKFGFPFDSSS